MILEWQICIRVNSRKKGCGFNEGGWMETLYVWSTDMLTVRVKFGIHPAAEQTNMGRSSGINFFLEQSVLSKARLVAFSS